MLERISDKFDFRIERLIAQGGMGSVYDAIQLGAEGFEKRVAIKALLPELSTNPDFIRMFIGEGKLVADLVHENIVQIYQLGQTSIGYYIVMEYVNGLSLHEFIQLHRKLRLTMPVELAVFITSRIARGLAYAHSRQDRAGQPLNIVHRDVCPNNIMVTTEGLPKLGDFGIAKAANASMPFTDQWLVGKFVYMSPEQARRQPVDFRADIYSLGLVLYELLALVPAREDRLDDILKAAQEGHANWSGLPQVHPDLLAILVRMLAVARDERYPETAKLAYDLEYYIYHKGYGPTVVTLESYLRKNFPYLYRTAGPQLKTAHPVQGPTVMIADPDAVTVRAAGTVRDPP